MTLIKRWSLILLTPIGLPIWPPATAWGMPQRKPFSRPILPKVRTYLTIQPWFNSAWKEALDGSAYAGEVFRDIREAESLGAKGVPFFVLDRKYAVSGAQPEDTFRKALEQAYAEWSLSNQEPLQNMADGAVCTPDGECK